jgi:hypothetical protein
MTIWEILLIAAWYGTPFAVMRDACLSLEDL